MDGKEAARAGLFSQSVVQQAALIVIAGVVYTLAQTTVNRQKAVLPVLSYLECIRKVSTFDWAAHGVTDPPSSSEVCKERAGYQR